MTGNDLYEFVKKAHRDRQQRIREENERRLNKIRADKVTVLRDTLVAILGDDIEFTFFANALDEIPTKSRRVMAQVEGLPGIEFYLEDGSLLFAAPILAREGRWQPDENTESKLVVRPADVGMVIEHAEALHRRAVTFGLTPNENEYDTAWFEWKE